MSVAVFYASFVTFVILTALQALPSAVLGKGWIVLLSVGIHTDKCVISGLLSV